VVADNLSDEQLAMFKKMFDMMDKDKNGNLSFEELKDGLSMIGHAIPDPDVQMLMEAVSASQQYKHLFDTSHFSSIMPFLITSCYFQYLKIFS